MAASSMVASIRKSVQAFSLRKTKKRLLAVQREPRKVNEEDVRRDAASLVPIVSLVGKENRLKLLRDVLDRFVLELEYEILMRDGSSHVDARAQTAVLQRTLARRKAQIQGVRAALPGVSTGGVDVEALHKQLLSIPRVTRVYAVGERLYIETDVLYAQILGRWFILGRFRVEYDSAAKFSHFSFKWTNIDKRSATSYHAPQLSRHDRSVSCFGWHAEAVLKEAYLNNDLPLLVSTLVRFPECANDNLYHFALDRWPVVTEDELPEWYRTTAFFTPTAP